MASPHSSLSFSTFLARDSDLPGVVVLAHSLLQAWSHPDSNTPATNRRPSPGPDDTPVLLNIFHPPGQAVSSGILSVLQQATSWLRIRLVELDADHVKYLFRWSRDHISSDGPAWPSIYPPGPDAEQTKGVDSKPESKDEAAAAAAAATATPAGREPGPTPTTQPETQGWWSILMGEGSELRREITDYTSFVPVPSSHSSPERSGGSDKAGSGGQSASPEPGQDGVRYVNAEVATTISLTSALVSDLLRRRSRSQEDTSPDSADGRFTCLLPCDSVVLSDEVFGIVTEMAQSRRNEEKAPKTDGDGTDNQSWCVVAKQEEPGTDANQERVESPTLALIVGTDGAMKGATSPSSQTVGSILESGPKTSIEGLRMLFPSNVTVASGPVRDRLAGALYRPGRSDVKTSQTAEDTKPVTATTAAATPAPATEPATGPVHGTPPTPSDTSSIRPWEMEHQFRPWWDAFDRFHTDANNATASVKTDHPPSRTGAQQQQQQQQNQTRQVTVSMTGLYEQADRQIWLAQNARQARLAGPPPAGNGEKRSPWTRKPLGEGGRGPPVWG